MSDSEDRVTVWMSDELREQIDDEHVDWRYSSRSEWVREAAEFRVAVENALDGTSVELPDDSDERMALLEKIARAGAAAVESAEADS